MWLPSWLIISINFTLVAHSIKSAINGSWLDCIMVGVNTTVGIYLLVASSITDIKG
jgi:hypothetical protein